MKNEKSEEEVSIHQNKYSMLVKDMGDIQKNHKSKLQELLESIMQCKRVI
jgi:hypothetical protein